MAHPIEKATPAVASPDQHLALFGPPRLLEGEDSAVYDALYASVCAAVKPRDIIEEILVNDFIAREWDVLRYRRQKTALQKIWTEENLEEFLTEALDVSHYKKEFATEITDILKEDHATDEAQDLLRKFIGSPNNIEKVEEILQAHDRDVSEIHERLAANKANQLKRKFVLRKPSAVNLVNKLLSSAGKTIDFLTVDALTDYDRLTIIERMDRLATVAELRREAALKELDRHRLVLGEAARQLVQDVEFEEIEAAADGKAAS
jgi:hypothetical protein